MPPSSRKSAPVVSVPASSARYTTAAATSRTSPFGRAVAGCAALRTGFRVRAARANPSFDLWARDRPGETQLTWDAELGSRPSSHCGVGSASTAPSSTAEEHRVVDRARPRPRRNTCSGPRRLVRPRAIAGNTACDMLATPNTLTANTRCQSSGETRDYIAVAPIPLCPAEHVDAAVRGDDPLGRGGAVFGPRHVDRAEQVEPDHDVAGRGELLDDRRTDPAARSGDHYDPIRHHSAPTCCMRHAPSNMPAR